MTKQVHLPIRVLFTVESYSTSFMNGGRGERKGPAYVTLDKYL